LTENDLNLSIRNNNIEVNLIAIGMKNKVNHVLKYLIEKDNYKAKNILLIHNTNEILLDITIESLDNDLVTIINLNFI